MNVLEFVKNSGGRIFGDDFDITKVNTLNNASIDSVVFSCKYCFL